MSKLPRKRAFKLPTWVSILFCREEGRVVAHNLDFDLAVEGRSMEEATELIKVCTKAHIEYALENRLENHLYRSAPDDLLALAQSAEPLGSSEVILVNDKRKAKSRKPVEIGILPRTLGYVPSSESAVRV